MAKRCGHNLDLTVERHTCVLQVFRMYMVCVIRALKHLSSHFHSADVKKKPVPIKCRRMPLIQIQKQDRHIIDMSYASTLKADNGHNE